jgi:hypothetical protein
MSRWVRHVFGWKTTPLPHGRRVRRWSSPPPRLEKLEDRLAPAVQLIYRGPGTSLTLLEETPSGAPVFVRDDGSSTLTIDLSGGRFAADSTLTAIGLTYSDPLGRGPAFSDKAFVNISAANNISDLMTTLTGDTLNLETIKNTAGGVSQLHCTADQLTVTDVIDTTKVGPGATGAVVLGVAGPLATSTLVVRSGARIITAGGPVTLTGTHALNFNGSIVAQGGVGIAADEIGINGAIDTTGAAAGAGAVTLTAAVSPGTSTLTVYTGASVRAKGPLTMTGAHALNIDGTVSSPVSVFGTGGQVTVTGTIDTTGAAVGAGGVTLSATGTLDDKSGALIKAGGAVSLGAGPVLNLAGNVTSPAGVACSGAQVTVTGAIDTTGAATGAGGVSLSASGSGTNTLTVSPGASIAAGGMVSLSATNGINLGCNVSGTTVSFSVLTTGKGMTLSADVVVTAGAVAFNCPVDGGHNLTVNSTSTSGTSFSASLGSTTPLTSLTINGTTGLGSLSSTSGVSVQTTGAQTYNGSVTLFADTTLTSTSGGNITFGNLVISWLPETFKYFALTVNTGGTTTFKNGVGDDLHSMSTLTIGGGGTSVFNGGNAQTTGAPDVQRCGPPRRRHPVRERRQHHFRRHHRRPLRSPGRHPHHRRDDVLRRSGCHHRPEELHDRQIPGP